MILFDPTEYNAKHKPLLVSDYKLDREELHKHAVELTKIRGRFQSRAQLVAKPKLEVDHTHASVRSRKGLEFSTQSRDKYGLSVALYQQQAKAERWHTGKMKKRQLKQLTASERVSIIHGSLKQLHSNKDIAA